MYRDVVVRTSRVYAQRAPALYAAFAHPGLLAVWWGPDGFSSEFVRFDFTAGGRWDFDMIGPDGARQRNESVFVELEADSHVVIRHESPPRFQLEIRLVPMVVGTQVTWTQCFDDEFGASDARTIVEAANERNLDRLATVLTRFQTGTDRLRDAPGAAFATFERAASAAGCSPAH